MGLAWVQNDCKTRWIPNIWKNEEKGRGTCKALAPADVRGPLRLPRELRRGWGGGGEARGAGGGAHSPASRQTLVQVLKEQGLGSLSPNQSGLRESTAETRLTPDLTPQIPSSPPCLSVI